MIKSVSAGGSNIGVFSPGRVQERTQTPFPKLGGKELLGEEKTGESRKLLVAGAKMTADVQSIIEEENGVVRLNADGDRLEVSQRAISLAKERVYS